MTPEEAWRDALMGLGGVEQTKESVRDGRGIQILETLIRDVRFGVRKYNVVGVMPPRFQYPVQPARVELWIPIAADRLGMNGMASQRGVSYLEVALLALIGVGVGLVGSLFVVRLVRGSLYGIEPTEPMTFVDVSLLLVSVSLLPSYIPARLATRLDPMVALRYE